MDRRSFLKKLGIGAATVAVAPIAVKMLPASSPSIPAQSSLAEYNEYTNFSQFALQQDWEKMISDCAAELGRRAGEDIIKLQAAAFS